MDKNYEYDARISAIHNRGEGTDDVEHVPNESIRHREFRAMADTFLGERYDRKALDSVESLQVLLRDDMAELRTMLEQKRISPAQYVERLNRLSDRCFLRCENLLGEHDFQELFGAPYSEHIWRINLDEFRGRNRG